MTHYDGLVTSAPRPTQHQLLSASSAQPPQQPQQQQAQHLSMTVAEVTAMLVGLHSDSRTAVQRARDEVSTLGVFAQCTQHTFTATHAKCDVAAADAAVADTTAVVQWDANKSMAAPPRHVPRHGDTLVVQPLPLPYTHDEQSTQRTAASPVSGNVADADHGGDGGCDVCNAALRDDDADDDDDDADDAAGVRYTLLRRRGARLRAVVVLRQDGAAAARALVQPLDATFYFVSEQTVMLHEQQQQQQQSRARGLSSTVSCAHASDGGVGVASSNNNNRSNSNSSNSTRHKRAVTASAATAMTALEQQQCEAATMRLVLQRRLVAWLLRSFARDGGRVRALALADVEAAFPVLLLLLRDDAAARRAFVEDAIDRFARDELRCFGDAVVRIRAHAQRCFLLVDTAPAAARSSGSGDNNNYKDGEVRAERRATALQLALTSVLLATDTRARDVVDAAAELLRRLAAGTAPPSVVLLRSLAIVLQPLHALVVGAARVPREVCAAVVGNLYALMHAERDGGGGGNDVRDALRALQTAMRRRDGGAARGDDDAAVTAALRQLAQTLQRCALCRGGKWARHPRNNNNNSSSGSSGGAAAAAAAMALTTHDATLSSVEATSVTLPSVLQAHEPSIFFAPSVVPPVAAATATTTTSFAAMLRGTTTTTAAAATLPILALDRGSLRARLLSASELPAPALRRVVAGGGATSPHNNSNNSSSSGNGGEDEASAAHLADMLALYAALSLKLQPLHTLVTTAARPRVVSSSGGGHASATRTRGRGAAGDVTVATSSSSSFAHALPPLQLNLGRGFAARQQQQQQPHVSGDKDDDDDDAALRAPRKRGHKSNGSKDDDGDGSSDARDLHGGEVDDDDDDDGGDDSARGRRRRRRAVRRRRLAQ